jgi:hypothetical protein
VADGWCWFVLREKYCWLVAGGWFLLREKHCWLVADKPSEQAASSYLLSFIFSNFCVSKLSVIFYGICSKTFCLSLFNFLTVCSEFFL